jgi:hypothetical protein
MLTTVKTSGVESKDADQSRGPQIISTTKRPKRKPSTATSTQSVEPVRLSAAGVPFGALLDQQKKSVPVEGEDNEESDEVDSLAESMASVTLHKRRPNETKEEKKLRKATVKAQRKLARERKKAVANAFKHEEQLQRKQQRRYNETHGAAVQL